MGNRYDIIKGIVPLQPVLDCKKVAKLSRRNAQLEEEIRFLIETYEKMSHRADGINEFRRRVNRLYLEGQVSEKAYNKIAKMYKWQDSSEDSFFTNLRGGSVAGGSCGAGANDGGRC